MDQNRKYGFNTLALHAGQERDPGDLCVGGPGLPDVIISLQGDTKHAVDLFGLKEPGNIYTRIMNPTQDILEKEWQPLKAELLRLCLASGTSAVFLLRLSIAWRPERKWFPLVTCTGGTYTMFNDILPQFGISVRFVDYDSPDGSKRQLIQKPGQFSSETIGNPMLGVPDFDEIASIAHEAHVPLIVDSTFTPPCIFRPMERGVDIVVHSLTKWIGGNGTGIGGIVVDSGRFDWTDRKFRLFNDPEPSYFGIRFGHDLADDLQPMAYVTRMRLVPLRNLGACVSPDNAWIFIQGLETLALRMERHSSNALAVARHLKNHPAVAWVRYPD